jgi:hypothetical protein
MKNTHAREANDEQAPASRRARAAVGTLFLVAVVGSAFDAAQDASSIPQSEYVAPPALDAAELVRFAEVERALEGLQLDAGGDLRLDSNLAAALAQATTHIPTDAPLSSRALQRHQFLIHKALPEPAAAAFANHFATYAEYRRAAEDLLNPRESATLADEAQRLAQLAAVRREHFAPAIADALFGKEERLADYMLALQRLEQDTTLTSTQKEAEAAELQRAYEAQTLETP